MSTQKKAKPVTSAEANDATPGVIVPLSVRLPLPTYEALRRIVFEEKRPGNRVSIHSLILEGIGKVVEERNRKHKSAK